MHIIYVCIYIYYTYCLISKMAITQFTLFQWGKSCAKPWELVAMAKPWQTHLGTDQTWGTNEPP